MKKNKSSGSELLNEEDLRNLTAFFDVLIQIDLEQKRNTKLEAEMK